MDLVCHSKSELGIYAFRIHKGFPQKIRNDASQKYLYEGDRLRSLFWFVSYFCGPSPATGPFCPKSD